MLHDFQDVSHQRITFNSHLYSAPLTLIPVPPIKLSLSILYLFTVNVISRHFAKHPYKQEVISDESD